MPQDDDYSTDDILPQSERLQALSPEEYELLWGHPVFSDSDRALFFQLNAREQEYFGQLRTPKTRANFLLQLGYFRARQRFFVLTPALVADDLAYLREKYLEGKPVPNLKMSKVVCQRQLAWILDHFGFECMSSQHRDTLESRALDTVRISGRPLYVMRDQGNQTNPGKRALLRLACGLLHGVQTEENGRIE